ncbi:hypothetical protein SADUNF_Sadunf04G0108900 [Salix dunnii]|uniref:Uncharacterized protein n=1 Tax=Salix dunnii TaxID=1413687 RepID=A0A835K515_9ROSI|nr:hypothetical protein SADUNF_Sadunf04G0108900 [Salix dunnii]
MVVFVQLALENAAKAFTWVFNPYQTVLGSIVVADRIKGTSIYVTPAQAFLAMFDFSNIDHKSNKQIETLLTEGGVFLLSESAMSSGIITGFIIIQMMNMSIARENLDGKHREDEEINQIELELSSLKPSKHWRPFRQPLPD